MSKTVLLMIGGSAERLRALERETDRYLSLGATFTEYGFDGKSLL